MFDFHVLDMIELGIERFTSMYEIEVGTMYECKNTIGTTYNFSENLPIVPPTFS